MKIAYRDWNPNRASGELVTTAESIITEYLNQGYVLTLRQLYYQFVSRDIIPNTERSYKNLGNLITKARMAGMISWSAIEDRGRGVVAPVIHENLENLINAAKRSIRFDRWERQDNYVEVWVEKEALGNVISKACRKTQTPYLSCKGYLSASEAWRAGRRLKDRFEQGQTPIIIHLGDHDPSGIDMTRDNAERLEIFSEDWVEVKRIALNMDQVEQYTPPPNPTKLSDTRAANYISACGYDSWELDALEPSVIRDLIESTIDDLIDWDIWHDVDEQEQESIDIMDRLESRWDDVLDYLAD